MKLLPIIMSTVMASLYVIITIIYKDEYDILIEKVEDKRSLKAIYLPFMIFISKNIKNQSRLLSFDARKSIQYFEDKRYYKYYELLFVSKKIALIYFSILLLLFFISVISIPILMIFIPIIAILIFLLVDNQQHLKYKSIKNDMKDQLPMLLTSLSLLIESGIGYRRSIELITNSSNDVLSKEIKAVLDSIDNGKDEIDAYMQLTFFSEDLLIRKFISLIIQNLYKGTEDFSFSLKSLKDEAWKVRKSNIINKTKKASQKLLMPNLIIFASIMVMVMLPILLNVI
ncbi:MAG: hypothetical protein GXZ08_02155 [Tissierellia bacterium]|nr:hypothetical protein [Tissierellia bacterium]